MWQRFSHSSDAVMMTADSLRGSSKHSISAASSIMTTKVIFLSVVSNKARTHIHLTDASIFGRNCDCSLIDLSHTYV